MPHTFTLHISLSDEIIRIEHSDLSNSVKSTKCSCPSSSTNKGELQGTESRFLFSECLYSRREQREK